MASNSTRRTYPQQTLTEGLAAVPTSVTVVPGGTLGKDIVLFQVLVSNTTGGALTYLLEDNQASPLALIPTISIPANTTELAVFPEGIRMIGGAKHQASNTGLVAEVFGFVHA